MPTDDRKLRTWILTKGHGWRVEKIADTTHWWVCKKCHMKKSVKPHIYCISRATSAAAGHLEKPPYLITEEGPVAKKRRIGDSTMEGFLNGASVANGGDPVLAAQNEQAVKFDGAEFKRLLYD